MDPPEVWTERVQRTQLSFGIRNLKVKKVQVIYQKITEQGERVYHLSSLRGDHGPALVRGMIKIGEI